MNNIVIRRCETCKFTEDDKTFTYLKNGVWSCPNCGSMWTYVYEVINPASTDKQ